MRYMVKSYELRYFTVFTLDDSNILMTRIVT